jgi:hypothetical protein
MQCLIVVGARESEVLKAHANHATPIYPDQEQLPGRHATRRFEASGGGTSDLRSRSRPRMFKGPIAQPGASPCGGPRSRVAIIERSSEAPDLVEAPKADVEALAVVFQPLASVSVVSVEWATPPVRCRLHLQPDFFSCRMPVDQVPHSQFTMFIVASWVSELHI